MLEPLHCHITVSGEYLHFAVASHQGVIANPIRGRLVAGLEFGCAVQAGIKSLKESIESSPLLPPTHARHVFFIKGFFAADTTILGYPRFLNCKEGQSASFYIHEKGQNVANKFEN